MWSVVNRNSGFTANKLMLGHGSTLEATSSTLPPDGGRGGGVDMEAYMVDLEPALHIAH